MTQAAALPLSVITAWEGLADRASAGPGHAVVVHGGGVGHIAIQLANARGATVFATGRADSFEIIRNLGAQPIDYQTASVDDYLAAMPVRRGIRHHL
jgi:NADPH:quinone reductase